MLKMLRLKRFSVVFLVVLIAIVTLLFSVLSIGFAPQLLGAAGLSADEWSQLGTLVSVVSFAFALGAGVSILVQISEAKDSRNLGIYQDIYEKMKAPDELKARRHIYNFSMPDLASMGADERAVAYQKILADEEMRNAIKTALNTVDYFGFLVEQDWVTAKEIIGWLSPVVVKLWAKIGPVVEYERAQRPEEPDYYLSAVHLAHECEMWRDTRYPNRQKKIIFNKDRL